MSARMSLFWIALSVALLVACSGCGKGGVSPTGEGAPPVTATPSATADTTPATAATARTGQAQSGGGGNGNSRGGGSGNSGSGGSGNSGGGGGAQGAPLHIPEIILHIGTDLQTEYDAVFRDVATECGGTLCVSVGKEGTGLECGYTVSVNGAQISPVGGTDSQGNQIITVPRGASIVVNGNALGAETLPCPSDQPVVAVASDWISLGKPIGGPGDGGAFDGVTAAITAACGDGTSCVTVKVAGGPVLCSVDPQPAAGVGADITLLRGGTITLNGNADGSYTNCPTDNSGSPGGGSPNTGSSGSGSPGDQSTPSP
jgi:hypothetical protein